MFLSGNRSEQYARREYWRHARTQERYFTTLTMNVGGPHMWRRLVPLEDGFRDCPAGIIGFQEFDWRWLKIFRQHGHVPIQGEKAGDFYNPILYDSRQFWLSVSGTLWYTEDRKQGIYPGAIAERNATWGLFRHLISGYMFLFVNAHFDNVCGPARELAMDRTLEFIREYGFACQFSGDLNINTNREPEHRRPYQRALAAGLKDAYLEAAPSRFMRERTFQMFRNPATCGTDPYRTEDPDHVLLTRNLKPINCTVCAWERSGVYASDHCGVLTNIEFK